MASPKVGGNYRNISAPFTSEEGYLVLKGQVYEPTVFDLETRKYKLVRVKGDVTASKALPDHRHNKPNEDGSQPPFAGWASPAAEALAEEHELLAIHFIGRQGSGKNGAFTAADIREVIGE